MGQVKALTDRTLKALKPAAAGKRYEVRDAMVPGLVVRVTERGTRSFCLVARYPGSNNPTRRAVGEYGAVGLSEARTKARDWLALIERGVDPAIEAQRERTEALRKQADTFGAIAEKFIERKLKTQRRGKFVEYVIRKELLPHWAERPVTSITHRDVREHIEQVVDRAPTYAFNVFDAITAVLNFAVAQDAIEANPCRLLRRRDLIGQKRARQRVLNDQEIRAFWKACDDLDYPLGPFFKLILLTGVRLHEASDARWREFDFANKIWTIPRERFKSDAEHVVPLSSTALALLESLPRFERGDFLFSVGFGVTPVRGFSRAKRRLDHLMKVTEPFVVHDLRRTVRTRLSGLGVQDHIAESVIGHGRKGVARIYDLHRYIPEMAQALEKWAVALGAIVSPPPANVVKLKRR